ncbi:hypothetical protein N7492_003190 [Penicillium capsulatum]|uniref:Uncharacterized protein n=1 Tax=Penicillium capsulatum TaxID=69766 RepID=A0A9W9LWD1_9EURO|nr:hypothetical protein N7492_003190 [Penicillium capsulatum]KAJ6122222.1 hypothetical protein N7512_004687 [Penicillium capsulatum]
MGKPSDLRDAAPTADPSPPPYTEHDPSRAEQAPQYEAPTYTPAADGSRSIQSATIKFPPTLNGYFQWKLTTTIHLGPTAEEKLFAVSTHSTFFNKPSIELHDGPTTKDPVMASVRGDKWGRNRPFTITLPVRPGGSHQEDIMITMTPSSSTMHPTFSFDLTVGGKGRVPERFEWRKSQGNEIKELATGTSYGWKLLRQSGPSRGVGGSRRERDQGMSSDGLEILALIAHNASWSMTKGFRIALMGTGLTGTLGETWEIVVMVSALQLWYLDYQGSVAASGATAA